MSTITMRGSEKQIAWANDIRDRRMAEFEERLARREADEAAEPRLGERLPRVAAIVRSIFEIDQARFWIDADRYSLQWVTDRGASVGGWDDLSDKDRALANNMFHGGF